MLMLMSVTFHALFCLEILVSLAAALSFHFPSFDQTSLFQIELHPDASWDTSLNGSIQLTANRQDGSMALSAGRAVYWEPVLLWDANGVANFSSHFAFIINPNGQKWPGDGMAFFLSKYPLPANIPPSFNGCGLGLFNGSVCNASTDSSSLASSAIVAVEFDTYPNAAIHDPMYPHVGIDVGSLTSVAWRTWDGYGNNNESDKWEGDAWVSYDSSTQNLSVLLVLGYGSHTATYSLTYPVDLQQWLPSQVTVGFSASTGLSNETHTLLSWNFSSTLIGDLVQPYPAPVQSPVQHPEASTMQHESKRGLNIVAVVTGAAGLILLLLLLGLLFFVLWSKKKTSRNTPRSDDRTIDEDLEIEGRPKRFSYRDLAVATRNFSEEAKLGEGGFGSVYRGHLEALNLDVAIKRFAKGSSKQGKKEYISEVNIISRLRHRNLVQLVGWCHDQQELLLVYELLPNRSLDFYLYNAENHLGWPRRYKIVLDLASALLYLHHGWEQCVVHRDVKPSNIMLDSAFTAKLGDFGLARFIDHDHSLQTTVFAGTMGYVAPECINTGKASRQSDVYSFGVVALQIACGRRPIELLEDPNKVKLVDWVWELFARGAILEAVDEKLNGEFDQEQMERLMVVGLWCAHPDFNLRPSMEQAISMLNGEMALSNLIPPR